VNTASPRAAPGAQPPGPRETGLHLRALARLRAAFGGRQWVIAAPFAFLLLFFALPFLLLGRISVAEMDVVSVTDVLTVSDGVVQLTLRFGNYLAILQDSLYLNTYFRSLQYAAITTVLCLVIGYPFAYFMARAPRHLQPVLLMLVMLPFWTSFLLRVYAWRALLSDGGMVAEALSAVGLNHVLHQLGWVTTPDRLMFTSFSLVLGMVYTYLPFMILPLYGNLVKMDMRLLEAAADLGASPWTAFWKVTVPLSKAGIIAGSLLVFIPCIGEYVIPEMLGGPETLMIGRVLWDEFFSNNDWPMAAALAVVMVLMVIVPVVLFSRYQSQAQTQGAGR
jgi:putrescine transport system permease protein